MGDGLSINIPKWYEDNENLRQLAEAIEHEQATGPQTSEFLEKPWKWEPEWSHLQKYGNLKEFVI